MTCVIKRLLIYYTCHYCGVMGKKSLRVSRGEMDILSMFWGEGELTLQEAHQRFSAYAKHVAYPTMQTRLNRMVEKKLLSRSDERPSVYQAVVTRRSVASGHLRELSQKLGGGEVVPLVAQLISERPLSEQEIDDLTDLLVEARRKTQAAQSKKRRKS